MTSRSSVRQFGANIGAEWRIDVGLLIQCGARIDDVGKAVGDCGPSRAAKRLASEAI